MTECLSRVYIDALVVFPHEGVDANDGKDEPEDETHQEDVEDAGQGADQSVDNNLEVKLFQFGFWLFSSFCNNLQTNWLDNGMFLVFCHRKCNDYFVSSFLI